MNYRLVFSTTGRVMLVEAGLLCLPVVASMCYAEWWEAIWFMIASAVALAAGSCLMWLFRPRKHGLFAKEGLLIVGLTWLLLSLIGALPFVLSGEIPSYIDALFETVSGFTTTGASILSAEALASLSHGALFWRSFTHWVGGMGLLVFVMMTLSRTPDRSMHILRAEMPGPLVDKVVPRARDTSRMLYLMYFSLTVAEVIFLLAGGMDLFDSLIHSFGTAGTGGFAATAASIGAYSNYHQWVIAVFMILFGVNFNLYYLVVIGKLRSALKSTELWAYLGIVGVSIALVTANILKICTGFSEALRLSVFQVSSIVTTTGFSTTDFALWPAFARGILFLLMMIGSCAGSTAGGLKVSRVVILFKMVRRELRRVLHPNSMKAVRTDGRTISDETLVGVSSYFALYTILLAAVFLLLTLDPGAFDFETNLTAAVACYNNVGPGLGSVVGPAGNYGGYSIFSKIVLSLAMLLGRLEIYPMLLIFLPRTWTKK